MSETPDLSTLPARMRWAALIQQEALKRCAAEDTVPPVWTANTLRGYADQFEADDRAAAEREQLVEELAKDVHDSFDITGPWHSAFEASREEARRQARKLLAAGWTKAADQ